MKKIFLIFTLLLSLACTSHAIEKRIQGKYRGTIGSLVVYSTNVDCECKEQEIHLLNTTNMKDSCLDGNNAFVSGEDIYYNLANKIHLLHFKDHSFKDSVVYCGKYEIQDFHIQDNDLMVVENYSNESEDKALLYFCRNNDKTLVLTHNLPSQELEGQLANIFKWKNFYIIQIRYGLYIFDSKTRKLTTINKSTSDAAIDTEGNVYYTTYSVEEGTLLRTFHLSDINNGPIDAISKEISITSFNGFIPCFINCGRRNPYVESNKKYYLLEDGKLKSFPTTPLFLDTNHKVRLDSKNPDYFIVSHP